MQFDYSKLLGLLKEKGMTQEDLATIIGRNKSTVNLKINGKAYFTVDEMNRICKALGIAKKDIGKYFFANKVQKN